MLLMKWKLKSMGAQILLLIKGTAISFGISLNALEYPLEYNLEDPL